MFVKDLSLTQYGINDFVRPENQKWITPNESDRFYRGGTRSLEIWEHLRQQRCAKYPKWKERITPQAIEIAAAIQDKGYYKIENFWDTNLLDAIKEQTLKMMSDAPAGKVKYPQDGRHTQVVHPLENIVLANEMIVNKKIQSIASAFLGSPPGLGTTNLRLSTAEKLRGAPSGTNLFHKDFNSPVKFIKFFTYFNDVSIDNGPFTYVESSNRELPSTPHWSSQHRWPDDTIEQIYGKERIINNTANYGDLLIATTNGFHKGLKLKTGNRLMLTLNYVIHPELGGSGFSGPPQKMHTVSKETYEQVEPEEQYLYDFMEKV